MTDVIAWPPVDLTGWEFTLSQPVSRSVMLFSGRPRTSSFQRRRRLATAVVPGMNLSEAGAGYMEMLKDLLAGGENLVRVDCEPGIWPWARSLHTGVSGTPGTAGGWPIVTVSGLPANAVVVRPAELITATDGTDTEYRRALRVTASNGSGVAAIRLSEALTLTGTLDVTIGGTESVVFEASDSLPRAVQRLRGDVAYSWAFREVFEDEYETWTEVNPWG